MPQYSGRKVETKHFPETFITTYPTTRSHKPQGCDSNLHCNENPKSHFNKDLNKSIP